MVKLMGFGLVAMAVLLSAPGCSGASSAFTGTSPVDAVPAPVHVGGIVQGLDGTPVPGATVCLLDGSACTDSSGPSESSAGSFVLSGVPAGQYAVLTFRKTGFLPSLRVVGTQTGDVILPDGETLFPEASAQTLLGTVLDPARGHIGFSVMASGAGPAPRVAVTVSQAYGSSYAPVYFGADGSLAPGATEGTGGAFVNLAPGSYVLRFAHSDATCTASGLYGQPVSEPQGLPPGEASVLVPVLAGYVTTPVRVSCAERAP